MTRNLYRAVVWFEAENFEEAATLLKMDGYTVTELQEKEKSDD